MACRIFEDSGFFDRLRSVPEDDEGVDIQFLDQGMQKAEKEAKAKGNNEPVRVSWPFEAVRAMAIGLILRCR